MSSEPGESLSLYSVSRSALVLTGGAVAVQVLGIVRELFLAAQIGATAELDALLIALVLPTALPSILTSGAITALVPAYLEARHNSGLTEAQRLAGAILVWTAIAGAGIWIAVTALAVPAVAITGPGLTSAGRAEAVGFLQLLAPLAFITAISAILFAVCQAEQRFLTMSAASFAGPAATLATMLLLWDSMGLRALAIGSLIGPGIVVGILIVSMVRASLVPILVVRPGGRLGPFIRHAAPLTVGAAILQINTAADRAVASLLGPGAVSVLRYADVLVRVPVGAIGPAWGSAIYPALVRSTLGGVVGTLASDTQRTLRYAIAVFVPVAMLTMAVAPLAVTLAYDRGAFSSDALRLTAGAVAAFAPLLLILMVSPILTGAHNARRSGRVLLTGATLNVIVNTLLDVVLGFSIGVVGVALASSITSTLVLLYFARRLEASEPAFKIDPIARTFGQAVLASMPATLAAGILFWSGFVVIKDVGALVALTALGILGGLGYVASATLIGMDEPRTLVDLFLAAVRRRLPQARA